MRRYLVAYLVLVVLALAAAFGLAKDAGSQAQLPEQSPWITACNMATAIGAKSQVRVTNCRRIREEILPGNVAIVEVSVKANGMRWVFWTTMYRSEWQSHAYTISPQ